MDSRAGAGNAVFARDRIAHEVCAGPVAGFRDVVVDRPSPVGVGDGTLIGCVVDAGIRDDKLLARLDGCRVKRERQRVEVLRRFNPAHDLLALRKRAPMEVKRHRRIVGECHGARAICVASSAPTRRRRVPRRGFRGKVDRRAGLHLAAMEVLEPILVHACGRERAVNLDLIAAVVPLLGIGGEIIAHRQGTVSNKRRSRHLQVKRGRTGGRACRYGQISARLVFHRAVHDRKCDIELSTSTCIDSQLVPVKVECRGIGR